MADIIQVRRGTAAYWTAENPTLADGEMGLEIDTGSLKFGDGVTDWVGLAYFNAGGGGGGEGNVTGPASAAVDRIAVFDGTTGKLIKDGGRTIAELKVPSVQSVASAATVTPAFGTDLVKVTAQAAALTLANPSGTAIDGFGFVIRIKDDGTVRGISYGTQYRAIGVTLPTTTTIGKTLYLAGIWNVEDTTLDIVAVGQQA